MDKKIAGLLGAVATLGTFGTAEAAPPPAQADVLQANSYADLLEPIPNAGALLQAIDESAPQASENVQLAPVLLSPPPSSPSSSQLLSTGLLLSHGRQVVRRTGPSGPVFLCT
jgi:hypothetical protein